MAFASPSPSEDNVADGDRRSSATPDVGTRRARPAGGCPRADAGAAASGGVVVAPAAEPVRVEASSAGAEQEEVCGARERGSLGVDNANQSTRKKVACSGSPTECVNVADIS